MKSQGGPNEITRVLICEIGRKVKCHGRGCDGWSITEQDGKMLSPSPSSYCSLHDRPIIKRQVVGATNRDFIQKVNTLRRWWTHAPENHLAWVRIQVWFCFYSKRGGSKVKHFQVPVCLQRGGVNFFFSVVILCSQEPFPTITVCFTVLWEKGPRPLWLATFCWTQVMNIP